MTTEQDFINDLDSLDRRVAKVKKDRDAPLEACKAIRDCIDSGMLVRNTSNDFEDGWAFRQIPLVRALQELASAIAQAESPEP